MKTTTRTNSTAASENIARRIEELADWRGEALARVRKLIHDADPEIQEEWKWMGTPVWSHDGGVCTGESYKQVVKLTFFRGAALKDPKKLFNSKSRGEHSARHRPPRRGEDQRIRVQGSDPIGRRSQRGSPHAALTSEEVGAEARHIRV